MITGKNRYYKNSKISEAKFRQLLKAFAMDFSASDTAKLIGLSTRSTNSIFLKIRSRIAQYCEIQSPFTGDVEMDESYFGPTRIRGKRGRGAGGKTIVFGIYKRNGSVFTEIVPDAKKRSLLPVIRGQVSLDSIIHTDGWRGYDGLVDVGYAKHYRVLHGENEFANSKAHINGIESFWAYAKLRLAKFKGITKRTFYLHLKETEFRFNHRRANVYKTLLKLLRTNPI
jgi:transposase-like protein